MKTDGREEAPFVLACRSATAASGASWPGP